jgi:signal transduction histidine kinase
MQWRDELAKHNARLAALNQQLQQAVTERDESLQAREAFIAIASHELRNPLSSLYGTIQLARGRLERGDLPAERLPTTFATLERQATRLVQLVQRVFDVSRLSTGQLEVELAPLDLAQYARTLVHDIQTTNQTHKIALEAPDRLQIVGDAGRLLQILGNLINNAIKFGPEDTPIEVKLRAMESGGAQLSVRDYGPGIPPEHRGRVFERFYQAGPRAGRGLGLGLYLSRELVDAHGGRLDVEFPDDGGTRFVVHLPMQRPTSLSA